MWPVVVGKSPEICFAANTCDDMDRIATINETAAIETTIAKPFCLINIKLIIINLLIKKALSITCSVKVPKR